MLSYSLIPAALAAIDFHRIADGFRMPFQDNYYLWKAIGYGGILTFGSRFFVQWLYSEKHKESKVPPIFWWQSMVGTILCLAYALRQKDSVFMAGYIFNLIPYIRNIMLIRRKNQKLKEEQVQGFAVATPAPGK
jgi:lipid-A-disaccharide synthase-like uncharacterized protein